MLTVTGVYAPNVGQIEWNWTANDNGSPITEWALTLSFNGSVVSQTKIPGAPNYSTGVGCGGGAWTLQVAAINSVGQSAPLTSSPVTVQPNCSTQPTTTTSSPSTTPTTQPTTAPSSSSTGCGLTCISRTIITICLACFITTTTGPIIQGPDLGPSSSAPQSGSSPPLAQPVSQTRTNAPSARLLVDAVAFGFHVPFHTGPPTGTTTTTAGDRAGRDRTPSLPFGRRGAVDHGRPGRPRRLRGQHCWLSAVCSLPHRLPSCKAPTVQIGLASEHEHRNSTQLPCQCGPGRVTWRAHSCGRRGRTRRLRD